MSRRALAADPPSRFAKHSRICSQNGLFQPVLVLSHRRLLVLNARGLSTSTISMSTSTKNGNCGMFHIEEASLSNFKSFANR